MASLIKPTRQQSWALETLNKDFCPSLNAYVYWLKEPVGWFALAALASLLAGIYVNPIGWTLAASICVVTAVGIAWPWIAIKAVRCEFHPQVSTIYEHDRAEAIFRVQNRLPVPIWGLALEGFLDSSIQPDTTLPTISLAWVPPLCTVDYPLELKPDFRGRYPQETPKITSSFPFGIWTAKRKIAAHSTLLVWPQVYPISGTVPFTGTRRGDIDAGQRSGGCAEPLGCRPYRIGDSPRHIHWRLSARSDSLIVVDRSAGEQPEIEVSIDLQTPEAIHDQGVFAVRQQLAWQTRITASILTNLASTHTAFFFVVNPDSNNHRPQRGSKAANLDQLALIPELGTSNAPTSDSNPAISIRSSRRTAASCPRIEISGHAEDPNVIVVRFYSGERSSLLQNASRCIEIQCDKNLARTINRLWAEFGYASIPA